MDYGQRFVDMHGNEALISYEANSVGTLDKIGTIKSVMVWPRKKLGPTFFMVNIEEGTVGTQTIGNYGELDASEV